MTVRQGFPHHLILLKILVLGACLGAIPGRAELPEEPISIGHGVQFVFDRQIIDNYWPVHLKIGDIYPVYHQAKKYAGNPLSTKIGGYAAVTKGADGKFRAWYQTSVFTKEMKRAQYGIAYGESEDGLTWTFPTLKTAPDGSQLEDENFVLVGNTPGERISGAFLVEGLPEADRRGYTYLLLIRVAGKSKSENGIRLVGSQDGLHWDLKNSQLISSLHSDTLNSLTYDPEKNEYVLMCRPKHIFRRRKGDIFATGESRRVARISSLELWKTWEEEPQTILIPDQRDAENNFVAFYGMPTRYYGGVYWGFLWPFRFNDNVFTEVAVSRNGWDFFRDPKRQPLIPFGEKGSWDAEMIFAQPNWVEQGEEWWIYYTGWNGPHGAKGNERQAALGLAKIRKEGFVSMHAEPGGGVLCSRKIVWPGGDLYINAAAMNGKILVRAVDAERQPIAGFDYADMEPFQGDATRAKISWKANTLEALAGQVIRLEFHLEDADLYSFVAQPESESPPTP